MGPGVIVRGKLKSLRSESKSEQGDLVAGYGPEAEVIYPWPG